MVTIVRFASFLLSTEIYCAVKYCADTLTVKVLGDCFEIELPNEHIVAFPNHLSLDKITYIRVKGDLKVTSFKFE
ncbi:UNVERIFIED_CONTAM: hypothetical protein FKN15_054111 [Acipenser sinensis]